MRDDFNKQLTERERLGHKSKFGDYRNAKLNKALDEDMSGGKESIHARRRNAKGGANTRKQFNENLNPLRSFLHTNLGRPWDKIYSEITTAFDKRKVINNHILEHLFQYVELDVHIVDGKPCTRARWRSSSMEFYPIQSHGRMPSYYVDPRDGLLKTPKRGKTKREVNADKAREAKATRDKIYRKVDDDNHLVYQKGTWWLFQAKDKPAQVVAYERTPEWSKTQPADWSRYALDGAWKALPDEEKAKHGKKVLVAAPMPDAISSPDVPGFSRPDSWYGGPRMIPDSRYFCSKTAAGHKLLKSAGVAGTIPTEDVPNMSHREASKYRPKKAGQK